MSQHLFAFERVPGVLSEPLITGAARTQLSLPFSGGFESAFGRGSLLVCGYFSCLAAPSLADPARDGRREQEDPPAWELGDSRGSAGSREVPGFARMSQRAGSDGWELAPGKVVTAAEVQSPSLGAAALLQDINALGQGLGKSYMLPGLFQTKTNSLIGGAWSNV